MRSTDAALVSALILLMAPVACAPRPLGTSLDPHTGGRVITEAQIARSGAVTARDVVVRSGSYLSVTEQAGGRGTRVRQRGSGSITLNNAPVLVLDGVEMVNFDALRELRAAMVARALILSSVQATLHYGSSAGTGGVVVSTKAARSGG